MQCLEYSYSKILFVVYSELKFNCEMKVTQLCLKTLCDPMDCNPPGFSVPWNSPGKNIEVGCHSLLQGLLLTQGTMEKEAEITDVTSHPAALSLS